MRRSAVNAGVADLMESGWRRRARFLADHLDRLREPGWPRRIVALIGLMVFFALPYPLHVTGELEITTLTPTELRTLTPGVLVEVSVHALDEVESGKVVARLLNTDLQLEHSRIRAELAEVEAQLRLAERGFREEEIQKAKLRTQEMKAVVALARKHLDRQNKLHGDGVSSLEQVEHARSDLTQKSMSLAQAKEELKRLRRGFRVEEIQQARAKVEQFGVRLREIEQRLEWTEVTAPISGVVVTPERQIQAQIGKDLPRGSAILSIVDPARLVARIQIPEREFGDVQLGQAVSLRAYQFPAEAFRGTIEKIEPVIEQADEFLTTVPVIARLEDAPGKLRPKTTGKAKIHCGDEFIGYIIYRRFLRSIFIQIWSWF